MLISVVQQRDSVIHYFPICFITGYWIYFPVLQNGSLSFIHFIYNSLLMLIPNSQAISLYPSPRQSQICSLCLWVCFCHFRFDIQVISYWYLPFSFWLTLLVIISRSIHVAVNGIISFFLWLSSIPLYICTTSFLISWMDIFKSGHLVIKNRYWGSLNSERHKKAKAGSRWSQDYFKYSIPLLLSRCGSWGKTVVRKEKVPYTHVNVTLPLSVVSLSGVLYHCLN